MSYEFFSFEEALEGSVPLGTEGEADRRKGPRQITVYRIARVFARGDHGLARVLNISDHGLMISARLDLMLGDEATVDLSETCSLTGQLIWRDADWCGLKLAVPIDSIALLRRLKEERAGPKGPALSLPVDKKVVATSEFGMQLVRLRDISQRTAKLVHDGRFHPGLAVRILIIPGMERRGVVRSSVDGIAEVELTEWLTVDQLGSMKNLQGR